ncbi:MAG TPA: calcium-binding protein [Solirubrobacterales bacterium]|nr:calcium-binding protein [Solirubrobacterales bacterium]
MYIRLRREGPTIAVVHWGAGAEETLACDGPLPEVRSLDRIVYEPVIGAHTLDIDQTGGPLAPGATGEPGGDEIEIVAKLPKTKFQRPSSVRVVGSEGDDWIRAGQMSHGRKAINLDVGRDGMRQDADLMIESPSRVLIRLFGGGGADLLSADGGREFAGPVLSNVVALVGSTGNDHLFGGPGNDHLRGDDGDDLANGGRGRDRIAAGLGSDRLFGGAGRDELGDNDAGPDVLAGGPDRDAIHALDGAADRVVCGTGVDNAWVDAVDRRARGDCEKLHGPSFPR